MYFLVRMVSISALLAFYVSIVCIRFDTATRSHEYDGDVTPEVKYMHHHHLSK